MKSEHRHELQTNELSAGLALWIERVKPYVGQIVTGVVALVVVYAGLTIWKAQAAERDHAAWDAYAYASDSSKPGKEDLLNAAQNEDFDGSTMQEWAYITWADGQVAQAIETYCYEREITNKALENASGVYNNLIEGASDQRVLNRARFGMARVYEMQNKIDQASELYLQVRGDLQLRSSDRAEQLESEEVREACEWLATIELPKPDLTGGQGASGIRPDFDAALPGFDGINLEDLKKALDESTAK